MASYYLMMDVGGTEIKTGIFDREGRLVGNISAFPARAKESGEVIFSNFASVIEKMGERLPQKEDTFQGIGLAFPGPFDYEKGISLMRGLDKYDEIYGERIPERIREKIQNQALLKDCCFLFLHDVEAFALGESRFGEAAGRKKIFCLCIGTGAGSAFVEDGRVIKQGNGVPSDGWIYRIPFRAGRIDDYLSVRGLRKQAERLFPDAPDGAALFRMASSGEERAKLVFQKFGKDVLEAIRPFLQKFSPDALILGGQISKSFPFFGVELEKTCKEMGIQIVLDSDTSKRAMEGLYVRFQEQ